MRALEQVTLIGVDCVDVHRLLKAAEICQHELKFADVRLLSSLDGNHQNLVRIDPIQTIEAYSSFMIQRLNSYVDTAFALVIQHDGFVLNPKAWCDEFLAYDYIGAPWWINQQHIVGNGGFSLRSKRLLGLLQELEIQISTNVPEDWFICVVLRTELEDRGITFAPIELAQQFALEGNENDGVVWTNQFGFHGLRWTDISNWLRNHPETQIDNTLDLETLELKRKTTT
jgi:Protein of unknown function (DUF5672)